MPSQIPTAMRRPGSWYRGDCHIHTTYSDGELSPARVVVEARAAGLAFIASTEHNTTAAHGQWQRHAGDQLLVILGVELTTARGHWLALGLNADKSIDWDHGVAGGALRRGMDQVHRRGGICVVAHPFAPYPTGTFEYALDGFDAVEVWNGLWRSELAWNADNEAALAHWADGLSTGVRIGSWRPAVGNSDTHLTGQIGTVVLAEDLTTHAILAGLRSGRSWIAESNSVDLSVSVTANGVSAGIGEWVPTDGEPAVLRATVRGLRAGLITVHTDHGRQFEAPISPGGPSELNWTTTATQSAFVRLEVRHPDGDMAALTNPILLR